MSTKDPSPAQTSYSIDVRMRRSPPDTPVRGRLTASVARMLDWFTTLPTWSIVILCAAGFSIVTFGTREIVKRRATPNVRTTWWNWPRP